MITLDFFGIHNGRRIVDKSTGVVSLLADGILVIRKHNLRVACQPKLTMRWRA